MTSTTRILAAAGISGLAVAALAGPAAARPVEPLTHSPAYWEAQLGDGATCEKIEFEDGTRAYESGGATFVYIKAGKVYYMGGSYETIETDKDISFVITCDTEPYGGGGGGGGGGGNS